MFSRQVQVDRSVLDFGVPQQYLNGAQIGAGFEQMGRETVPEGLPILLIVCSQPKSAIVFIRLMAQKSK
jgi:hypothetical protein